jgi:hypothetical protein
MAAEVHMHAYELAKNATIIHEKESNSDVAFLYSYKQLQLPHGGTRHFVTSLVVLFPHYSTRLAKASLC